MIIPSEWVEKADAFFMDAERHVNEWIILVIMLRITTSR